MQALGLPASVGRLVQAPAEQVPLAQSVASVATRAAHRRGVAGLAGPRGVAAAGVQVDGPHDGPASPPEPSAVPPSSPGGGVIAGSPVSRCPVAAGSRVARGPVVARTSVARGPVVAPFGSPIRRRSRQIRRRRHRCRRARSRRRRPSSSRSRSRTRAVTRRATPAAGRGRRAGRRVARGARVRCVAAARGDRSHQQTQCQKNRFAHADLPVASRGRGAIPITCGQMLSDPATPRGGPGRTGGRSPVPRTGSGDTRRPFDHPSAISHARGLISGYLIKDLATRPVMAANDVRDEMR